MKRIVSMLALMLLGGTLSAGELVQTVNFSSQDLRVTKSETYDVVELSGYPANTEPGKPRLPRVVQALVIPAGAAVTEVTLLSDETSELLGTYNLIPCQKPVPLPMPGKTFVLEPVFPDPLIYSQDKVYPSIQIKALSTGSMCGYRIGHIELFPLRYNPVKGKLYFTSRIAYRVKYTENSVSDNIPTQYQKSVFGEVVRAFVVNPNDVSIFAPRVANGSRATLLPLGNYHYVTISGAANLDTVFTRLAKWKTKKGIRDTVVGVSWINANYTGYDLTEKIRNFIKDARTTWGTVYVLLGGQGDDLNSGQNLIPSRHAYYITSGVGYYPDEDLIPSDLYYSDLDGTWDANGNYTYGELADNVNMYPDVFVGRTPVLTVADAQNFVSKVMTYEKNPPTGYLKKMLLPTAILWSSYEERPVQRAIAAMTPSDWLDDSLFERNGTLSQAAMVNSMNQGRGMGHWVGHGNETGIYYYNGGAFPPYYTSSNADAATNGTNQGIAISIACFTGAMDEVSAGDCFAEHIINRVDGGCVGVMMNSRYGWGSPPAIGPSEMIDTTFYHRIFGEGLYKLGEVLASTKSAWVPYADSSNQYDMMRWCLYELNLFGDPELPLWTTEPETLLVTHNPTVPVGPSNFTVTVIDKATNNPISDALVCAMFKDGSVYTYGNTNALGEVTLNVNPPNVDTLFVTATAKNHLPYEGYALVVQSGGPYVAHLKHSISDPASGGNNDGIINPGEIIRMPTWIKNYGIAATSGSVTGKFVSRSSWMTPGADSLYIYGTLNAGDSAQYSVGYDLTIAGACTNGVVIPCSLLCYDNDSSWVSTFSLTVGAPVLVYASRTIDGNGRLDPNETAKIITTVNNTGLGNGYNVQGILRCSEPLVQVTDSVATFGTINYGTSGTNSSDSFVVSVGNILVGTNVTFTLVMNADGVPARTSTWEETIGYAPTGPDAGNYYAVEDSDGASRAPVYQWVEIRGAGGTQILPGDDGAVVVSLPFNFTWYGVTYNQLSVCGNGWIGLGNVAPPAYYYNNVHLPSNATNVPRPAVFGMWDDIDPSASGWVGYMNDVANQRFIVEYDAVPYYETSLYYNTFEFIFYDSTGSDVGGCAGYDVVVQYKQWQDRSQSGIGIQNAAGTIGLDIFYDGTPGNSGNVLGFYSQKAIRYTQIPSLTGITEEPPVKPTMPKVYALGSSYPNPFSRLSVISYQLPVTIHTTLKIYNVAGQLVKTLVNEFMSSGVYRVSWDGKDEAGRKVSAGVYFYRLTAGDFADTKKMILIK
ncbi:MAG: C25 family cysteine peptidase [Candidatus Edwardsbacteria bacterium]